MQLVRRGNHIRAQRSVWRDGKVTTEYLGSGLLALLWAEDAEEEREAREAARRAFRAIRARDREFHGRMSGRAREAKEAARRELEANGVFQHARGQWRRRKGFAMAEASGSVEVVKIGEQEDWELIDRATGGRFVESWAACLVIRRETKGSKVSRDEVWKDLAATAETLAGPDPSPSESLLARAAAMDWMMLSFYRAEYEHLVREGTTFAKSAHYQDRLDRTHKRMCRSIKMLETVRRLRRPSATIKVRANVANVAAQQINGMPPAALEGGA